MLFKFKGVVIYLCMVLSTSYHTQWMSVSVVVVFVIETESLQYQNIC